MRTSGYAFAPPAFYAFCKDRPGLCSTQGGKTQMHLDAHRLRQLRTINRSVNQAVRQRQDRQESWTLPGAGGGDCEDLAILKKAELMKQGWPASTLLLTVGTLNNTGHTVLTVRTDRGDLILDNLTNQIKPWSRTPYRYFARQEQNAAGDTWSKIGA